MLLCRDSQRCFYPTIYAPTWQFVARFADAPPAPPRRVRHDRSRQRHSGGARPHWTSRTRIHRSIQRENFLFRNGASHIPGDLLCCPQAEPRCYPCRSTFECPGLGSPRAGWRGRTSWRARNAGCHGTPRKHRGSGSGWASGSDRTGRPLGNARRYGTCRTPRTSGSTGRKPNILSSRPAILGARR
jgi:hypothetical protein